MNSLNINSSPDEPYNSFMMNSFYKANYYSQYTGMITLSDDSGLEVDCLGNQPGVYSARYGGADLSDKERNDFLISNLPVDEINLKAKFKCVITLYLKNRWVMFFEGSFRGNISRVQKGTQGHGYDPIFYVPEKSKTFGELDISVKNLISHRAKALNKLSKFIDDNFNL